MNKNNAKGFGDAYTALFIASHSGHFEIVRLLLAHQDVDVKRATASRFGEARTAKFIASHCGRLEVVRLLLAHQDVDRKSSMRAASRR